MGMPTSYKRARRSPSPQRYESPDMRQYRDWSPLAAKPSSLPPAYRATAESCPPADSNPGSQAGGKAPMEQLSDALLLKIVQMSQPTAWDLCRMSCVSKAWRRTCGHRSFWTRLRVGSGSLRAGVEQLAPRCTELTELFVDDPRCELHILHPIIIACSQSLRRVVIDCDRDTSNRNEASVSSVLWLVSLYCKNVESIELQSNGREATVGSLEGRTMWYLTSAFRNIRYFACLAKGSLTKQCIYLMAIAWRDLECLRINMDGLHTEDLLALKKCTALRALELVGGSLTPVTATTLGSEIHGSIFPANHSAARLSPMAFPAFTIPGVVSPPELCVHATAPVETARREAHGTGAAATSVDRTPTGILQALGMGTVFHPSLELLVLNRVEFDACTVASLALMCPSLKRILVSGALCDSCLLRDGPCRSSVPDCVRKQVDLIQLTLSQVRVSLRQ